MSIAILAIVVLSLVGCASTEQAQQANTDSAVAAAAETGESELICKRIKVIGSNFRKKVCGTKEDWGYAEDLGDQAALYIDKSRKAQTAFDN